MRLFTLDQYQDTSRDGFTKRMMAQSSGALLFMLNFEPGQALPAHTHEQSQILVTVVRGEGEATIDQRTEPLKAGTVLQCEGGETFSVRNNGPGPLSLMVTLAPGNPRFAGNVR